MHANASNQGGIAAKAPIAFWIIAVLSLLWNAVGAFDYLATQLELESYMSQFTQEQLDYFYGFPKWATSVWAIAIWSSVAGSIGLLLRKKWAVGAFGLALVGLALSGVYSFLLSNGAEIMGTGGTVFTLIIWIVAIFLLIYSKNQAKAGVLT